MPTYLVVAAIYITICGLLSIFAWWLQRRMSRLPRTAAKVLPAQDAGADASRMV